MIEMVVAELAQLGPAHRRHAVAQAAQACDERVRAGRAQPSAERRRFRRDIAEAPSFLFERMRPVARGEDVVEVVRGELLAQLRRRALGGERPEVHDRDTVAVAIGLVHLVGRDEHGRARLPRAAPASRSQTSRRAVGSRPTVGSSRKRMLRPVQQRGRDLEAAEHAAREVASQSRSRNDSRPMTETTCSMRSRRSRRGTSGDARVELEVLAAPVRALSIGDRLRDVAEHADGCRARHGDNVSLAGGRKRGRRGRAQQHGRRTRRVVVLPAPFGTEQPERTPRARRRRRLRRTATTSPKRTTRSSTSAPAVSPLPLIALRAPRSRREALCRRLLGEPDELDALVGVERLQHFGGERAVAVCGVGRELARPHG